MTWSLVTRIVRHLAMSPTIQAGGRCGWGYGGWVCQRGLLKHWLARSALCEVLVLGCEPSKPSGKVSTKRTPPPNDCSSNKHPLDPQSSPNGEVLSRRGGVALNSGSNMFRPRLAWGSSQKPGTSRATGGCCPMAHPWASSRARRWLGPEKEKPACDTSAAIGVTDL